MKKRKTGKLVSKVKGEKEKRWKIFSKENLKWGLGGVVVLSVVSFWLLSVPCKTGAFPSLSICFSNASYLILNFFGLIILELLSPNNLNISDVDLLHKLAIMLNAPIYYLIGIFSRKIFNKIKK